MKRLSILLIPPCSRRIRRWLGALCKGATAALRIGVLLAGRRSVRRLGRPLCAHRTVGPLIAVDTGTGIVPMPRLRVLLSRGWRLERQRRVLHDRTTHRRTMRRPLLLSAALLINP